MPVESVEFGPGLELALRLVPHEFAERNQLLPYAADTTSLWVAMADPTNMGVIDELAFRTGRNVKLSIAGDREIARAIRRLYLGDKRGVEAIALDERGRRRSGGDDRAARLRVHAGTRPVLPAQGDGGRAPGALAAAGRPALPRRCRPAPDLPRTGPEARLAAAVRGLRKEDDVPVAVRAPMPWRPRS